MAEPQAKSSISFKGTIAFNDQEAARKLNYLVNDLVDNTLHIFWKAKDVPELPRQLTDQLEEFRVLTFNFVNSARTGETQKIQKALHDELTADGVDKATTVLREYKNGEAWNFQQVEVMEAAFKTLFTKMQTMMNQSESETATSIARNCSLMITAAHDMKTKQDDYSWESLIHNVDHVQPVVMRQLRNRITVTEDAADKRQLTDAADTLEAETPLMSQACQAYRDKSGSAADKDRRCESIKLAMQRAIDVVSKHIIGDSSFKYKGIEAEKFNGALDDILSAIQRGDGDGLRNAAGDLNNRVRDAGKRSALADAANKLREQTKDLLGAAKDALKNKDSEDASNYLKNLISGMKDDINAMAEKEAQAEKRRRELLKSAGGLGLAVDQLANSADAFRGGKEAPKLDFSEIDRQEKEREDRVAQGNAAPVESSAGNDAELDDLLADLDGL